jgi:hypothetical protein
MSVITFAEVIKEGSSHGGDEDFRPSTLALGEGSSDLTRAGSTKRVSERDSTAGMTSLIRVLSRLSADVNLPPDWVDFLQGNLELFDRVDCLGSKGFVAMINASQNPALA